MRYCVTIEPMDEKKDIVKLVGSYFNLEVAKIDSLKLLEAFPGTIRTITIVDYDDGSAVAMWDGDWG